MKNKADYSKYECPYSHLEKENGHELHGPEGYEETYSVWCTCGFRGPVLYLEPEELGLKLKNDKPSAPHTCPVCGGNGLVSPGFYSQTPGDWMSVTNAHERCRSCNGTGVLWG